MAMASPTPIGTNAFRDIHHSPYRTSSRYQMASTLKDKRPTYPKSTSFIDSAQVGDSSDEELPAPIMFSDLTNALLNHQSEAAGNPPSRPKSPATHQTNHDRMRSTYQSRPTSPHLGSAQKEVPKQPSYDTRFGSPAPKRIVRLSAGSSNSVYRRTIRSGSRDQYGSSTPASSSRIYSSQNDARSNDEGGGSHSPVDTDHPDSLLQPSTVTRPLTANGQSSATRFTSSTINRTKGEDHGAQSAVRVKRVGKVTGGFLSGPARRGRRRQSEEDQSPEPAERYALQESVDTPAVPTHASPSPEPFASVRAERPRQENIALRNNNIESSSLDKASSKAHSPAVQPEDIVAALDLGKESPIPAFRIPAPPPVIPSIEDKENEPPPTFKRNKSTVVPLMERIVQESEKPQKQAPVAVSPSRKALSARDQNTPLRAAPPPPKMAPLDSSKTGSTRQAQNKKRRTYVTVNGKIFNRMDLIGRGGSSRVYRVMAENYEVFALKKVTLEEADPLTIRGYKGEIDLLRKLGGVDRVVKLIDFEINDEKQLLSVLMEIGESDLNEILKVRLNTDNARFDACFTRHYWREMLECVQAVHKFDIVHSDLKPANFLLVQGRLKLIDFGIANAIQDDTVNVHREQQVGTPNYMSPEAIVDLNAKSGLPASSGRLMKLGKPSDVWSLGCILYQMVYGKPPFAHIQNPLQRIMAIANKQYKVEYPVSGVGGVVVPLELIDTLKGCLERDQLLRPTIEQLLDDSDPFLYPKSSVNSALVVSEALLRQVMLNMANHCQNKGIPTEAEIAGWSSSIYGKLKDHGASHS